MREAFVLDASALLCLLRSATRSLGLSLGDRACLALARHRQAVAVTADRTWGRLPEGLGIAVMIVR